MKTRWLVGEINHGDRRWSIDAVAGMAILAMLLLILGLANWGLW